MKRLLVMGVAFAALVASGSAKASENLATPPTSEILARLDAVEKQNALLRKEVAALREQNHLRKEKSAAAGSMRGDSQPGSPEISASNNEPPSTDESRLPSRARPVADMPTKAPIFRTVDPSINWTGCYIGANIGYARGRRDTDFNNGNSYSLHGGFVGEQVGCDFQSGQLLVGGELMAMHGWPNVKGNGTDSANLNFLDTTHIDWFGTYTARVGFALDRALFYVKGGGAWMDARYTFGDPAVFYGTAKENPRWGKTIGGGIEYMFMPGWSAKFEYSYLDFGNKTVSYMITFPAANTGLAKVNEHMHVALFGLNYHFASR